MIERCVVAAMVDLRTADGKRVLHFSDARWSSGDLRYSPFGGGLQVTDAGRDALEAVAPVTWLGHGHDEHDLRVMTDRPDLVERWVLDAGQDLREHTNGAMRELREELVEETALLSDTEFEVALASFEPLGHRRVEAVSTNPGLDVPTPTRYLFETYRAVLTPAASRLVEQRANDQHPPAALVASKQEIQDAIQNKGRTEDGQIYTVAADALSMFEAAA